MRDREAKALAVFMLITNSNFVGCSIGNSVQTLSHGPHGGQSAPDRQLVDTAAFVAEEELAQNGKGPPGSERQLSARSSTGSVSTKRNGRRSCAGIVCRCRVMRL